MTQPNPDQASPSNDHSRAAGGSLPRKSPCVSCPYRRGVPSGIWDAQEYDKLPRYDGEIHEQQAIATFLCHHQDGQVCAGWLGHRDPIDLLAVRLGISWGQLDPSCAEYSTSVPLFETGAEAAEHGKQDIDTPDAKARQIIDKIRRTTKVRGTDNHQRG